MQEQEYRGRLNILCGLSGNASEDIRDALIQVARERGYEAVCVCRYRKEGICQYIREHPEFRLLVLQEDMQGSCPYEAEELSELMDDRQLNIVISIRSSHRGSAYMKILYTAGILNALYEDDATAENIMKLLLAPRSRRECRAYYQITTAQDAMRSLDIVDEDRMARYITYIAEPESGEEIRKRYRYVSGALKVLENSYLAEHLPQEAKEALAGEEAYQEALAVQGRKKKRPFGGKKKMPEEKKPVVKTLAAGAPAEAPEERLPGEKQRDAARIMEEGIPLMARNRMQETFPDPAAQEAKRRDMAIRKAKPAENPPVKQGKAGEKLTLRESFTRGLAFSAAFFLVAFLLFTGFWYAAGLGSGGDGISFSLSLSVGQNGIEGGLSGDGTAAQPDEAVQEAPGTGSTVLPEGTTGENTDGNQIDGAGQEPQGSQIPGGDGQLPSAGAP